MCVFQFVNAPICCPSRSTLLTGRYPHNTGVRNNSISGGCASSKWRNELEPNSLAPFLKQSGYQTFYAGKYLNQVYVFLVKKNVILFLITSFNNKFLY